MPTLPAVQALRCFVAAAREGTVSAAAERLHLSQPAVSLQIKSLEEATGVRLFDRTPQGLVATRAGLELLPDAEAAIAALANFGEASSRLRDQGRQVLRVGTILDPDFIGLGRFLSELMAILPRVETQLRHGMSDDALAQVVRRELDVGYYLDLPEHATPRGPSARTGSGREPAIRSIALRQFTYRVAAPPAWAERVRRKGWKTLAGLPWLATPVASAHRRLLASVFGPLGVTPVYGAMTDQEPSMLDLLRSGVGLCLVREEIALREERLGHLALAERVSIPCVMSFICLEARATEPLVAHALDAARRAWQ